MAKYPGVSRRVQPERRAVRTGRHAQAGRISRARSSASPHKGPAGFYEGETALALEKEMLANGGLITRDDLKKYAAKKRVPVKGTYRGYEVFSMPPPSSGGIGVIEMLNVLEGYDLAKMGPGSANAVHLMTEAMKRSYRRSRAVSGRSRTSIAICRSRS